MTSFVIKVPSVITKPYTLTIKFGIKGRGINSRTKAQQINDKKNPAQLFLLLKLFFLYHHTPGYCCLANEQFLPCYGS